MSYRVTKVVGRATTRSFRVTKMVGRATSSRSFRVTQVVGRATATPVAGGTFKLTKAVGRAHVVVVTPGGTYEPFDIVPLPGGVWVQTSGPPVTIGPSGVFIAPAMLDGTDVSFQSGGATFAIHVNPQTVFESHGGVLTAEYVNSLSTPYPVAQ